MKRDVRFLFGLAAALGFPAPFGRLDADRSPHPPPELPAADRARLDAAAAKRARKGAARRAQALRCGAQGST